MLVLLNREMILVEMLEWARYRVAEVMHLDPETVVVKWDTNASGQIVPSFGVDPEVAAGLTQKEIQEVMKSVSWEMRGMIRERIAGASQQRGGSWIV